MLVGSENMVYTMDMRAHFLVSFIAVCKYVFVTLIGCLDGDKRWRKLSIFQIFVMDCVVYLFLLIQISVGKCGKFAREKTERHFCSRC